MFICFLSLIPSLFLSLLLLLSSYMICSLYDKCNIIRPSVVILSSNKLKCPIVRTLWRCSSLTPLVMKSMLTSNPTLYVSLFVYVSICIYIYIYIYMFCHLFFFSKSIRHPPILLTSSLLAKEKKYKYGIDFCHG